MILRIIDDMIELDGIPVARLLTGLNATTIYRLTMALDDANDIINDDDFDQYLERHGLIAPPAPKSKAKPKAKPNLTLVFSKPDT